MAGKSKDAERENKALSAILRGEEVEKRSIVGYTPEAQKNEGGKTRKSELTDIMASVRIPWFCPECKKAMKKKLDDKFWRMMGHCFDCQVEYENKLRVKGEFDEWAEKKMLENQKSQLKDLEQSITDFEKTGGKKEWYNNVGVNTPMLEADKWEMGKEKFEETIQEARDFIREKREIVEKAEQQLTGSTIMGNIIQMIMNLFFGGNQKKEVKELDKAIKVKDNEVKELEKEVKVLEAKKKVNKKEVAKLKRKVTTTKKQIEKASEAVKEDNADDAVKFLKKFSK